MNFTDQLAGAIHDVKNRMQLMLPHAEKVARSEDSETRQAGVQLQIGLEALNQRLVSLLGMYNLESRQGVQCQEVYVADMLSACVDYIPDQFDVSLICDEDFLGFFDENLVKSVVSDAIHNATRFAKSHIQIVATKQTKGIELRVEDDGPGFEENLTLEKNLSLGESSTLEQNPRLEENLILKEKLAKVGTGFGLRFALMVAEAHRNNGLVGAVRLGRSEALGGAGFSLYLP